MDDEQIFWANVQMDDDDRCWEWQGPLDSDGYGSHYGSGPTRRAHRLAYLYVHPGWDANPSELVLHSCDNRKCCNPNHLRTGSPRDNAEDHRTRGRFPTASQLGILRLARRVENERKVSGGG